MPYWAEQDADPRRFHLKPREGLGFSHARSHLTCQTSWNLSFAQKHRDHRLRLANESRKLVEIMRTFDAAGLSELMHISSSLAEENVQRFASWKRTCTGEAEPAVCLFQGDVYRGLAVDGWKATEHRRAASHLRILSGLYGLLRPHDMILPHRLEMGTKLDHDRGGACPRGGAAKSPRP